MARAQRHPRALDVVDVRTSERRHPAGAGHGSSIEEDVLDEGHVSLEAEAVLADELAQVRLVPRVTEQIDEVVINEFVVQGLTVIDDHLAQCALL